MPADIIDDFGSLNAQQLSQRPISEANLSDVARLGAWVLAHRFVAVLARSFAGGGTSLMPAGSFRARQRRRAARCGR
jgi:hypothetical protein